MFENFRNKFLVGCCATTLLTIIIGFIMIVPSVFLVVLVFAVVAYTVGSLLFKLGFKGYRYNEKGDLVRVKDDTQKYDDC